MKKNIPRVHTSSLADPQRGSIIALTAGVVILALALLGAIQLAYTFTMKRSLQNAADMAALTGAQALYSADGNPDCARASDAALAILRQNLSNSTVADHAVPRCGEWTASSGGKFAAGSTDPNAMHIHLQHTLTVFVPFMRTGSSLEVNAIAVNTLTQPVAAFSVGPRLLDLDNGIVHTLLEFVGLDAQDASILSHQGLANATVTPSGLLQQLGFDVPLDATVADMERLLDARVGVSEIVNASLSAADANGLLSADQIQVLEALAASSTLDNVDIRLFTDPFGEKGLFSLSSIGSDPAGLNANVGIADIAQVVLGAATQEHALDLGVPEISLGSLFSAKAHVSVIEPPSIGIGPTGTTAHSANIRAFARLCLNAGCDQTTPHASPGLLSSAFNIGVDLPIVIELVNGTGTLGPMCHRNAEGEQTTEIAVAADVLASCIGNFNNDPGSPNYAFSTAQSCVDRVNADRNTFRHKLLTIDLPPFLSALDLSLESSLSVPALSAEGSADFQVGKTRSLPPNALQLGTTVSMLMQSLLDTLAETSLMGKSQPSLTAAQRSEMANGLWEEAEQNVGCDPNPTTATTCRQQILERVESNLSETTERVILTGLGGFLLNTLESILDVAGSVVSGILNIVNGNPCTGGGLLNWYGSVNGCKSEIAKSNIVADSSRVETVNLPNILVPIVGSILNLLDSILQPALDSLGESVLSPLLDELGINLGQVDTTLISLDCEPDVRLVH